MQQLPPATNQNASISARMKQSLAALDLEHLNLLGHGGGKNFSRYLPIPTSHEMQSSRSLQDLYQGQENPQFNAMTGHPNLHLMQPPQLIPFCCNPYMCTCSHNNLAAPNVQINVWSEDIFKSEAIDVSDVDYPDGGFPKGGPLYPRRHRFIDGVIPRIKLRECPEYTIGEYRKPSITGIPEAFSYKPPVKAKKQLNKIEPNQKAVSTHVEVNTDTADGGHDKNLEQ